MPKPANLRPRPTAAKRNGKPFDLSDVRNRIVERRMMRAGDLLDHPNQWRDHPGSQADALDGVLHEVGITDTIKAWYSARAGGKLVTWDGHLRKSLDPDKEWPVDITDLTDEEADYALASHDPLGAMAVTNAAAYDALLGSFSTQSRAVQELLTDTAAKAGMYLDHDAELTPEEYSRKIQSPLYEPQGAPPAVSALYDDARTQTLVAAIQAAEGLSDDERAFLIVAAQRHTVLHFNRIADYYAHAPAAVQRLFEDSALVIIDFQRAIELGYVQLTQEIADLVRDEYGD